MGTHRTIDSVDALIGLLRDASGAFDSPAEIAGGDDSTSAREAVDLLAHALQCAHEIALAHPDDLELQVAALVHDIGHQLAPGDDAGHGRLGADAVRELLGARVARLVEHHVPAKRYLVTVDATYRAALSPVSIRTLEHQGGTMTEAELGQVAALPDWDAGLVLRRADDAAKAPGREVPGLDSWRAVLERVAAATSRR